MNHKFELFEFDFNKIKPYYEQLDSRDDKLNYLLYLRTECKLVKGNWERDRLKFELEGRGKLKSSFLKLNDWIEAELQNIKIASEINHAGKSRKADNIFEKILWNKSKSALTQFLNCLNLVLFRFDKNQIDSIIKNHFELIERSRKNNQINIPPKITCIGKQTQLVKTFEILDVEKIISVPENSSLFKIIKMHFIRPNNKPYDRRVFNQTRNNLIKKLPKDFDKINDCISRLKNSQR